MKRLLWIVAALGCLGAGGSPLVAWYMDRTYGVDVQMIAPHAPEVAAMERLLADETTPVVSLYGEPLGPPIRLVLLERTAITPRRQAVGAKHFAGKDRLVCFSLGLPGIRRDHAVGLGSLALLGPPAK